MFPSPSNFSNLGLVARNRQQPQMQAQQAATNQFGNQQLPNISGPPPQAAPQGMGLGMQNNLAGGQQFQAPPQQAPPAQQQWAPATFPTQGGMTPQQFSQQARMQSQQAPPQQQYPPMPSDAGGRNWSGGTPFGIANSMSPAQQDYLRQTAAINQARQAQMNQQQPPQQMGGMGSPVQNSFGGPAAQAAFMQQQQQQQMPPQAQMGAQQAATSQFGNQQLPSISGPPQFSPQQNSMMSQMRQRRFGGIS